VPRCIKGFFYIKEYGNPRNVIAVIFGHVACKPQTLQCYAMLWMESKLTYIKPVTHLSVNLNNSFFKNLAVVEKRLVGHKF
jgi:hypothetical protein